METHEKIGNEKKFLFISAGIALLAFAVLCLEITSLCIIAATTL